MSARIVLAVAAALTVAPAWADERGGGRDTSGVERESPMERAAPMERAESFSSAPTEWTKSDNGPDLTKSEPSDSTPSESRGAQWAADSSGSHAHARSSSGGSSSSGASARHSGGRSGGDRGGSHGGSSAPPRSGAQARHPRPGTGTGDFDNGHHGYYGGNRYYGGNGYRYGYGYGYGWPYYGYGRYGYYYPYNYWYSPYYYSGYYGYAPYFSASFGYGGDYHGHSHGDSGSVRILVDPAKARVYVDGSYAGIVDDFDGVFQRLNVPTGRHEITLKLEGYRTQHFNVYVPVDDTIKIHFDMVRGSGEATAEEYVGRPEDYRRAEEMNDREPEGRDDRYYRDERDAPSVRLQVNPRDASVYIDGEFHGSGRDSSSLRLRPGRHRIEVVRPGFRTLERDVDVEPGRGADVQVDLEKL